MFPLFESIKIVDGRAMHLSWHQERLNRSYFQLFGRENPFLLEKLIFIPEHAQSGIIKARFVYGEGQNYWEYHTYKPKEINSLKIVVADKLDYSLKYSDRNPLKALLSENIPKQEVIIVQKACVTDSSYSNLIFKSGDSWFTPNTPLLEGTCRARLLAEQKITPIPIRAEDVAEFSAVKLINAMLAPADTEEIPIASLTV